MDARSPATVQAALPAALHLYCLQRGVPEDDLTARGIPPGGFPHPDHRVPYRHALSLWDALAAAFPGEPVGLDFGAFLGGLDVGVVGLASAHARTLGDAIGTFVELQGVVDPTLDVQVRDGELYAITFDALPAMRSRRHPMEAMLASAHRTAERLAGTALATARLEFAAPPSASPERYVALFGAAPTVTDRWALVYAPEVSALPVPRSHAEVARYLSEEARRSLAAPVAGETSEAVLRVIEADLDRLDGLPSVERVARMLGRSPRTLQRQLRDEGASFRGLAESARRQRAEALLADGSLAVYEVAQRLGYAEPRAFQRAFKRWTGTSPSRFRER